MMPKRSTFSRTENIEKSEMLIFVLKAFRRQTNVMRRVGIWTFVLLITIVWLLPPIYESSTKISMESFSNPLGNSRLAKEISLPDQVVNDEAIGNRIEELNSLRLQKQVVDALGLSEKIVFDIVDSADRRWLYRTFFPVIPNLYQVEVKRPKLTRLIKISVRGQDPKMACELAKQYAESLIENSVQRNLEPSRRFYSWLLEATRHDLEASGDSRVSWDPSADGLINSIGVVASDEEIQRLNGERLGVEQKLRAARLTYFDQHPTVQKLSKAESSIEERLRVRTQQIVDLLIRVLNGEYRITNISILERALLRDEPIFPSRIRLSVEAMLLALAAALFSGLVAQLRNRRILAAEDLPASLRGLVLSGGAVTADDVVQFLLAGRDSGNSRHVLIMEPEGAESESVPIALQVSQRIADLGYQSVLIDSNSQNPISKTPEASVSIPWSDWVNMSEVPLRDGKLTRILPPSSQVYMPWLETKTISAFAALSPTAWVVVRGSGLYGSTLLAALNVLKEFMVILPQGYKNDTDYSRDCAEAIFHTHARTSIAILAKS